MLLGKTSINSTVKLSVQPWWNILTEESTCAAGHSFHTGLYDQTSQHHSGYSSDPMWIKWKISSRGVNGLPSGQYMDHLKGLWKSIQTSMLFCMQASTKS